MAGVCCAITAARAGLKVALVQDRPVLGGNASSEIRLWVLGATAHMTNNNRWSREGGVLDELLIENLARNPEGNAIIFDTVLLEKVLAEPGITLLLNTAAFEVKKTGDAIASVRAFCSQNSTIYDISAPLFCDASGDGIVAFLSGAAFRMGAEPEAEFGEKFAPSQDYGELLGHSIYFYSKDAGRPVRFTPPSYALDDVPANIPRYQRFNTSTEGCNLWWIEWGGRGDTVHDTEAIKWELWKVVYGVWNYIKNSGKFPDAANLTLEWVGLIPGKRESRRFEGPYMLRQQDIVEQRVFDDAVAHGGWSIDLHPADGIYSERPGCNQWHSRGVYQIPYRCLFSRNVGNLFLAGRIISTSHVAFGSTRVMATCACAAQAAGAAAAICSGRNLLPADLAEGPRLKELQRSLIRAGQHIPGVRLDDPDDLARKAKITASSSLALKETKPDGPLLPLDRSRAQMLPVQKGRVPAATFLASVSEDTSLRIELRSTLRAGNFSPDVVLASKVVELKAGEDVPVLADFGVEVDRAGYVYFCLLKNERVQVRTSETRVTGLLSLTLSRTQTPDGDIGVEAFEFWCPSRRPAGENLAFTLSRPLDAFRPENLANGFARPTTATNAWAADPGDNAPSVTLSWDSARAIGRIEITCDTDWDHPMESVQHGHPESVIPFCLKRLRVRDGAGKTLAEVTDNHQTRISIRLDAPVSTKSLVFDALEPAGSVPPALFEIRCYPG